MAGESHLDSLYEQVMAMEEYSENDLQRCFDINSPEVLLTPTYLAIVMEYAAGRDLFKRIYMQ
ncbi:hypothetical protein CCACVL1_07783 [Corchorus capsularis]|uniref:Uncharacterized protein n=1 Tax=Corchorus capsularis TaxID=210143 RepID=A0A1R3J3W6_COCAP|nr:hypothetical protein CCACVL1_07783 [Corchorus capsularis]